MNKNPRKRIKIGDVYAIPLPNGTYAFGRKLKDASIAIYKHIGEKKEDVPIAEEYQFIVGCYDYMLKSGEWPKVDYRPFANEEEAWPPPACVIDKISGEYSIYYKGEMRNSTKEECAGLEEVAIWGENHIIDRLMGDDKWHRRD